MGPRRIHVIRTQNIFGAGVGRAGAAKGDIGLRQGAWQSGN